MLKPYLKWFVVFILLVAIVVAIIYAYMKLKSTVTIEKSSCSEVEFVYYFFNIIGVFFTFLAIVTALFKEDILGMIHKPDLNFKLVDAGISENLEPTRAENGKEPLIAKSFDCYVRIENLGNRTACGCRAFISEIKYKNKKEGNYQTIINQENRRMKWMSDDDDEKKSEVDIPKNISQKIKLFEISEGMTTPSSSFSPVYIINFNGCELPEEFSKKGFWEISYYVSFNKGDISKSKISVDWEEGDFEYRAAEMRAKLEVKIL